MAKEAIETLRYSPSGICDALAILGWVNPMRRAATASVQFVSRILLRLADCVGVACRYR
jgi:hypothetical protein